MDPTQVERVCQQLPIFPLKRLVLMPGELLPLHVFEQRYRALVKYCQEGDGLMGIATIRPGQDPEAQAPAIYSEIGVGELVACQPYPDGRSTIVVQFVERCTMDREIESPHLFRFAQCATKELNQSGGSAAILRLRTLVLQLGSLSVDATEEARRLVELDGSEMLDSLARKLLKDTDERRSYQSADSLAFRVGMVEDKLAEFLQVASPTASA